MYKGFPDKLVGVIKCPKDGNFLSVPESAGEKPSHIMEGEIFCEKCGKNYSIRGGVLMLLSDQKIEDKFLLSEIKARDAGAFRYDGKFKHRFYKEILPTIKALGSTNGKNIIEYGCGTGRFTEIFSKDSDWYLATDFSLESLKIAATKISSPKIGLVLAGSITLKTKESFFDTALAFQLIEHIPSVESREIFFENIEDTLKEEGEFLSSTYHQDLRKVIKAEVKTGEHSGGIYFHNFSVSELKSEIGYYFDIIRAHPIDITLPFEVRLHLPPRLGGLIEMIAERVPVINKFGHLVLIKAVK